MRLRGILRRSIAARMLVVALAFGWITGMLGGSVAHAGPGNCSITATNATFAAPVGKTMGVSFGGKVVCFDNKSWIQFYGNLYTINGTFLDSFSVITYGINTNDHIESYTWQCAKTGILGLRNQPPPTFKIVLGYFATPWVGQQAFDEKTYYLDPGPCPAIRV